MKSSVGEMIFDKFNVILMVLLGFITLYPFWYVLVISFHDSAAVSYFQVYFWPKVFTLDNYRVVFVNNTLMRSLLISILRTLLGATMSVLFSSALAYGLSKRDLIGRKLFLYLLTVTMFFSGGLIPTFLLLRSLNLIDTFWVYIIPTLISAWNVIIIKTFFQSLPDSIEESAKIDGANDILIFFRLILPMSMPMIATMLLFTGVYHWNDWTTAQLFVGKQKLWPIQTVMMKMITEMEASVMINQGMTSDLIKRQPSIESIKMASIVVATFPIILSYPFLQKYFVKGIMIGSIKG
jgi:ABC-type sugar transport system, permease component